MRTHRPGKALLLMCKAREHNAYQRVFWTSECRIAPLSGQSRIILTIEWIQCQVVVYCLYFIADNCPIWCARTIRLEAHLPVVCVGSQKRKTNAIVACKLYSRSEEHTSELQSRVDLV